MQDPSVANRFFLAQLLWFLGYPNRALAMSQASLQDARELGHPFTLAWAIPGALWVRHHRGEYSEVRLFADKQAVLCREQRFQNWQVWSGLARGYSLLHAVRAEEGLSIMQEAVASLRRFGDRQWLGFTASILAKGCLCVGRRAEARQLVDDGLRVTQENGEGLWRPTLRILHGELLLHEASNRTAAARAFRDAMELARKQGAKSSELRAAIHYARLVAADGDRDAAKEAVEQLKLVYNWFTEGFDTKDLKEAKALLDELSA